MSLTQITTCGLLAASTGAALLLYLNLDYAYSLHRFYLGYYADTAGVEMLSLTYLEAVVGTSFCCSLPDVCLGQTLCGIASGLREVLLILLFHSVHSFRCTGWLLLSRNLQLFLKVVLFLAASRMYRR